MKKPTFKQLCGLKPEEIEATWGLGCESSCLKKSVCTCTRRYSFKLSANKDVETTYVEPNLNVNKYLKKNFLKPLRKMQ